MKPTPAALADAASTGTLCGCVGNELAQVVGREDAEVYRRTLQLKAKFESGSSHFNFKR